MNLIVLIFFNILRIASLKLMNGKRLTAHLIQRISCLTSIHIIKPGQLKLGRNVCISKFGDVYIGKTAYLEIGNKVYFNIGLKLSCQNKIIIGNNCIFGPDVKIYDNDHKYEKYQGVNTTKHSLGEIVIGNNCWIAANVVILKDTIIGDNCVIGAGTVVKGSIPANSLVTSDRELKIKPIE